MDPVSQGVLGAAAAQLLLQRQLGARAWLYGAFGGVAADIDVVIRSSSDPLVSWTYHRHFTHSLSFIPVGGAVAALPWLVRRRFAKRRLYILAATTAGYATHALLDACTPYGTQLLWPFSSTRIDWNWIGVVDPTFTIPMLVGVVWAARARTRRPVAIAFALSLLYLCWGGLQHARAVSHVAQLTQARGHTPQRVAVYPGLLTNVLWRSTYLWNGRIYVDAIHLPWAGEPTSLSGGDARWVGPAERVALAGSNRRLLDALATFDWFADGWVAQAPEDDSFLGDMRYGSGLATNTAMWGLELQPEAPLPYRMFTNRPRRNELSRIVEVWVDGF